MKNFVASALLNSHRILEYYYYKGKPEAKKLDSLHFSELYALAHYAPDHVIKNARQALFGEARCTTLGQKILCSLGWLAQPLEFRGDLVYVRSGRLAEWQDIILSVSPLTLVTQKLYAKSAQSPLCDSSELIYSHFSRTALPSVYEPVLESLVRQRRLSDCHMHLNGSTEPDIVWLDALKEPFEFYCYLNDSMYSSQSQRIDEQYLQLSRFDQKDVYRLLLIARKLRSDLINQDFKKLPKRDSLLTELHGFNALTLDKKDSFLQYEAVFLMQAFEVLSGNPNVNYAYWLHYYLLIRSFFQKLLVQQKQQVGFDQFQKITLNELREKKEKTYHSRFQQIQGMHTNSLGHLEARFAPKHSRTKLHQLIKSIKDGYKSDIQESFQLTLVPHFIKQPDTRLATEIITFRDLDLRRKNQRALDVLLDAMAGSKGISSSFLNEHLVGFDAASNELDASPEVFAPIYRKLATKGFTNFTYHAGEDFVHLLSGMRAVYEAITFLELKSGNRIGHATALGIEPSTWKKRVGDTVFIKQGEWLDNLVFAYQLCRAEDSLATICFKLEQAIQELFIAIYPTIGYVPIQVMIDAWNLRKYDPFIVLNWREVGVFDSFAKQELKEYKNSSELSRKVFEQYHSASVIERTNRLIEIDSDSVLNLAELRDLQTAMIRLLNSKRIIIETLISSNVRISHYKDYNEHHITRWLGLNSDNEPSPTVVLGTDDTGIFMTNIHNEYTHALYCIEAKVGRQKAEELLKRLADDSVGGLFRV